jgi:phosphate acetyltransferase
MPDRAIPTPPEPHAKYERLIKAAQAEATIKVAVAHPCDDVSIGSAVEAWRLHLIEPILVGPEARIRDVASRAGLDISAFEIVSAEHSQDSATKAVELVTAGRAEGLMKGSPYRRVDECRGVSPGIRTARRISHCLSWTSRHPDALIITDAAVNIAPPIPSTSCRTPSIGTPRRC